MNNSIKIHFSFNKLFSFIFKLTGFLTVASLVLIITSAFFASNWLIVNDTPRKSDAIVVLAGLFTRPPYAADLYKQGYASKIYYSKPVMSDHHKILLTYDIPYPRHEQVYRELLIQNGVSPENLIMYGNNVVSTIDEAESLKKTLSETPERLIVVTSPTHTRRAKIIFEEIFNKTEILMLATPYENFPKRWWLKRGVAINVMLEFNKSLFYLLGGAFRSTDQP
ncbi:MAG: YdcF family protein [Gammaproteobacteria bacterium]|nr:YdcF family protein [Gammaproteobacteria bacterium]